MNNATITKKIDYEIIEEIFDSVFLITDSTFSRFIHTGKSAKNLLLKRYGGEEDALSSMKKLWDSHSEKGILKPLKLCDQTPPLAMAGKRVDNNVFVFVWDDSKLDNLKKENEHLFYLNKQLTDIYEIYNYDTICITDEKGIVEFAGEACARHCGISQKDIIGKNMFELEEKKYFYPAVTVKVIESKKEELVIQDTSIGLRLFTIGVPIFDEAGNLKKVISISRDFSNEIDIAKSMIDLASDDNKNESRQSKDFRIITCSPKIYKLMGKMQRAANTNVNILLEGLSGTGKTLFANFIHAQSNRSNGPFISVNCGAIPENLFESELFGYEQGAFTGADKKGKKGLLEQAQGGTIFFDEIGEMPLLQQVKILHVIQDKEITRVGGSKRIPLNIRIIAATNRDLGSMVKQGTFREDLYYRINVVYFNIPTLADRKEDIPLLVTYFMNKFNHENGEAKEISEDVIKYLKVYDWPGNIRELENTIEMLCVTAPENIIQVSDLPHKIFNGELPPDVEEPQIHINSIVPMKKATEDMEKQLISMALEQCGNNHRKAAELLGLDRSTVTRKVHQYRLN